MASSPTGNWLPLLPLHARPVLPHTRASVALYNQSKSKKGNIKGGHKQANGGSAGSAKQRGKDELNPPATLMVDARVLAALRRAVERQEVKEKSVQRHEIFEDEQAKLQKAADPVDEFFGVGKASKLTKTEPSMVVLCLLRPQTPQPKLLSSSSSSSSGAPVGPGTNSAVSGSGSGSVGNASSRHGVGLDALYPMGVVATLSVARRRNLAAVETDGSPRTSDGPASGVRVGKSSSEEDLFADGEDVTIYLHARFRVALTGLRLDSTVQLPVVRVTTVPDEPYDMEARVPRALLATLQERVQVLRDLGHPLATAASVVADLDEAFTRHDASACADLAASTTTAGAERLQLTVLQQVDVPQKLRRVVVLVQREIEVYKLMMRNVEALNGAGNGNADTNNALANMLAPLLRGRGGPGVAGGGASNDRNAKVLKQLNDSLSRPGLHVPEHARTVIDEEMERLSSLDPQTNSSEHYSCRNYLQWLVALPWGLHTADMFELGRAREILNEDHFGIEDVKNRILEFIAISSLSSLAQQQREAVVAAAAAKDSLAVAEASVDEDEDISESVDSDDAAEPDDPADSAGSSNITDNTRQTASVPAAALGRGKIICLVGPPGVGKTSVGTSIARALGRKFVRFSCGGVHDTAEIKGHRRTYVGAMPGKIIQAMRRCGSANPVMLVDEIDKLGRHGRDGDPAAALLEAFDPEQNHAFSDLYCDVPFDLSRVLFVCTANTLETVPRPLLDRMEVIEMSGYFMDEKVAIAQKYLLPKLRKDTGLYAPDSIPPEAVAPVSTVKVPVATLHVLIQDYCREAGVRSLQKHLERLFRKAAVRVVETVEKTGAGCSLVIDPKNLVDFVGQSHFSSDRLYDATSPPPPGCVQGLAWNSVGGSVLWIETVVVRRNHSDDEDSGSWSDSTKHGAVVGGTNFGRLQTTGKLGEVIRESVQIAYSFARVFGGTVTRSFFDTTSLHTHFPEGATPKDGPSAGVTIVTSLLALALNFSVPADTAMTGEISLTGRVLPVGGIKEKIMAARRNGVKLVFLPSQNKPDFDELDSKLKGDLSVKFAAQYSDIFADVFGPQALAKLQALDRKSAYITRDVLPGLIAVSESKL